MSSPTVIVFGPTGGVGRHVAITAEAKGAKVILAMRDTSKSIRGLTTDAEKKGNYTRVQADLSDLDSVRKAVTESGAKRAFIYLVFGVKDQMKDAIQALKDSGIEFVVFLSSYTIRRNKLQDIKPEDLIPYAHGQVELSLGEIFGEQNFVPLRPGGFATNPIMWHKDDIKTGEVKVCNPGAGFDHITPEDMGSVGGTILVSGPKDGQHVVYLFGPEILTQIEAFDVISKGLGRNIKVTEIDVNTAVDSFKARGIPAPVAEYSGRLFPLQTKGGIKDEDPEMYKEGVQNIERYTGRPGLRFDAWVAQNKDLFD